MRPHGTARELEERRRRAIELLKTGKTVTEVARAVGASHSSVILWRRQFEEDGWDGLRAKPLPGRPSKLSDLQKEELLKLILKGPLAAGYPTGLWTLTRIGELIEERFGVSYHPTGVWRLLRKLGLSCQKPERRAKERDEHGSKNWKRRRWPHIKKRP